LAISRDHEQPALFMDHAVVTPAQKNQVVHHVLAAIGPMLQVMDVRPIGRSVATWEPAALVSEHQRFAL
jgi:hypothetical protein